MAPGALKQPGNKKCASTVSERSKLAEARVDLEGRCRLSCQSSRDTKGGVERAAMQPQFPRKIIFTNLARKKLRGIYNKGGENFFPQSLRAKFVKVS